MAVPTAHVHSKQPGHSKDPASMVQEHPNHSKHHPSVVATVLLLALSFHSLIEVKPEP